MDTCGHYRERLLDSLYGLLDAPERDALQEHLGRCPACQAALLQARSQQRLLAAAARVEFPHVRFTAPTPEQLRPAAKVLPLPRKPLPWKRVVAAAVVLVALTGVGVPSAVLYREYARARADADEGHAAVERTRQDMLAVLGEVDAAREGFKDRESDLRQVAADRQLKLRVSGPRRIESGAPNRFNVQTRNLEDELVTSKLSARVLDQNKQVLFEKKDIPSKGDYELDLPADLPLKGKSDLSLEVLAQRESGQRGEVREQLSLAQPVYVTHLETDKPLYHLGDLVRFRSLTLDRFSLKPPLEDFQLEYLVRLPDGKEVSLGRGLSQVADAEGEKALLTSPDGKPLRGIGGGEFRLPRESDEQPRGGEYALIVRGANGRFLEQQRKFLVNGYQLPRLHKELDWGRKSYGPGDEVTARCRATRVDGGAAVADREVQVSVLLDDHYFDLQGRDTAKDSPAKLRTDENGYVTVRFRLPAAIERGEGTLAVRFDDGSPETLQKPIPIVLKTLKVDFYPEGGDLIAGVPNKVYFQAQTPNGKPAEARGRVLDADGKVIVDNVETFNVPDQPGAGQGMGAFDFTPAAGVAYHFQIDSPIGIDAVPALPAVVDNGVVLHVAAGVTSPAEPIRVSLRSVKKDRNLLVGAYCRGRLMDHKPVALKKGAQATVELTPSPAVGGVYRITVFEEVAADGQRQSLKPLAERLVYRMPAERLDIAVQPDKDRYMPGDAVRLKLSTTNERGEATPAVLLAAVVDRGVISLADEKTARSMPTHFYLTTEVRKPEDMEHADFLLGAHPRAKEALDLLLGTQGWRRFAEQNPDGFREKYQEDAEKLLVTIGQSTRQTVDSHENDLKRLREEYFVEAVDLDQKRSEAEARWRKAQNDPALASAVATVERYEQGGRQLLRWALPLAGGLLVMAGAAVLLIGAASAWRKLRPLAVGVIACSLILLAALVVHLAGTTGEAEQVAQNEGVTHKEDTHKENQKSKSEPRDEAKNMPAENEDGRRKANAVDDMEKRSDKAGEKAEDGGKRQADGDKKKSGEELAVKDGKDGNNADRKPGEAKQDGKGRGQREEERKALEEITEQAAGKLADARAKEIDRFQAKDGSGKDKEAKNGQQKGQQDEALFLKFHDDAKGEGKETLDRLKKELGNARDIPADLDKADGVVSARPFVVREYAHGFKSRRLDEAPAETELEEGSKKSSSRADFTETLFWGPAVVLPNGHGQIAFKLNDSVTSFRVSVMGHTFDGRVGAAQSFVESQLPITAEPKLPAEIGSADVLEVPVIVANNTPQLRQVNVAVSATKLSTLQNGGQKTLAVPANERARQMYMFRATETRGDALFDATVQTQGYLPDRVLQKITVVPDGFPVTRYRSDILEGVARHEVVLPPTWVPGTLELKAEVFPSTLADLQKGLDGLMREPSGCFEQTSTANYPNLLILDYLKETDQTDLKLERRSRELLARGYQQLTSFECPYDGEPRHGFEWFGTANNAHEALTAYGLMQFEDLSGVQKVDAALLERTRQFLLSRRDGKGGFKRNPQALDTFGRAPDHITDAYIVWALTESGGDDVTKELNALAERAKKSKDPYFVSLVANALLNRDRAADASTLLKGVVAVQKDDGRLEGTETSITHSGGRDLQIETTALALLGWLKANRPAEFQEPVRKAVRWLGQQRSGSGGFGSTQATILALKALLSHARANKRTAEAGELKLFVADALVGRKAFDAGTQDVLSIALADAEKYLKPGKNSVRVEITGEKNHFPHTLSWAYRTPQPVGEKNAPLKLTTKFDRDWTVEEGPARLKVTLENVSGKDQGMAVAVIGLPAGVTLPPDLAQLRQHAELRNDGKEPGLIGFFEVRGRELVLYWRSLAAGQKIEVPVDVVCKYPGEYRGPASRAYLYYNADAKHWVEPLRMTIRAK